MGFYKSKNKINLEASGLNTVSTLSCKNLNIDTVDISVFGTVVLLNGKIENFLKVIDTYTQTINSLSVLPKQFAKDKNLSVLEAGNKILNSIMPVKSLFGNVFLPEKDSGSKARDEKIGNTQIRSYGVWFSNTDDIFNIIFSSYGIIDNNGSITLDEYLEESDAPTTTNGVINKKNQIHKAIFQHAVIDLKALENNISKANGKLGEILKVLKAAKIVSTTAKEQINCVNEIMLRTYKSAEDLVKIITRAYDWVTNNRINQESEDTELTSNVDIPSEVDPELAAQDLQDATQEINASIDAAEESEVLEADANDELQAVEDRLKSGDPIDPVEVAIVNESIQNYYRAMGIERKNASISLEDIKTDSRTTMEGLKVELEDLVTEIKNFAFIIWRQIVKLFSWLYEAIKNVFRDKAKKLESKYNALLKLSNDMDKNREATRVFLEKYPTRFTGVYNVFPNVDKFSYISKLYRSIDRNAMSLANYITGRNNDNDAVQRMNPLGSLISNLKEINPDFIRSANIKDAYNMAVVGLHTSGPTIEIRFASLTGEMNTTILTRHEYPSSLLISPSYLGVYINAYLTAYKLGKETADNIDRKFGIKANNEPRTENKIVLTACRLLVKTFVGMHTTVMNDLYYFLKAASDVVIKTYK